VSPLSLRRYRAERLLREEFDQLKSGVIAVVRGRLRTSGVRLDASDLEACYAQAWHGLYAALLDGQEIANPTGWLSVVTYRRAIEEHRARARADRASVEPQDSDDLDAALDDRVVLRQLFEGLRGRLSERELQAAALCYLQGMSRSEAAARMGVSDTRMRKLMEGYGAGRPGVAGKVGALVETIRGGGWCEEQGSLMRGLAYGILDPEGERYRLATMHRRDCPACRAYVLSLRGLAALVPPVPALMHWALGTGAGAAAGTGAVAAVGKGAAAGKGTAVGTGTAIGTGAAAPGGPGAAGALSASGAAGAGAAGAGAAGGGWLLAGGSAGAKLAVGCLLALGIGAGCAALGDHSERARVPIHRRESARAGSAGRSTAAGATPSALLGAGAAGSGTIDARRLQVPAHLASSTALTPAARASREFGPEQGQPGEQRPPAQSAANAPAARLASTGAGPSAVREPSAQPSAQPSASAGTTAGAGGQSAGARAAEREFTPG